MSTIESESAAPRAQRSKATVFFSIEIGNTNGLVCVAHTTHTYPHWAAATRWRLCFVQRPADLNSEFFFLHRCSVVIAPACSAGTETVEAFQTVVKCAEMRIFHLLMRINWTADIIHVYVPNVCVPLDCMWKIKHIKTCNTMCYLLQITRSLRKHFTCHFACAHRSPNNDWAVCLFTFSRGSLYARALRRCLIYTEVVVGGRSCGQLRSIRTSHSSSSAQTP